MDDQAFSSGLLPEGLRDGLPPMAGHHDKLVRGLQDGFERNGYDLVAPPLVEFEDALRGRLDAGQGNSNDAFRLLDPISQRSMIVRSDITRQVARIATTRMANVPRPLRLSYTGSALRTSGSQLQPSRQLRQVGLELIGADGPAAAAELADIVYGAFDSLSLKDLTFDLAIPGLLPALCEDLSLSKAQTDQIKAAVDDKDAAALAHLPEKARILTTAIMNAIGPAQKAVETVSALNLPGKAGALWRTATQIVETFITVVGAHRVHLDPGEVHGFSYQAGWALSVFGDGIRGELGRGGAYMLQGAGGLEPALGFTFYPDVFADHVPLADQGKRLYVAAGASAADIHKLQNDGYKTLRALSSGGDIKQSAHEHGCDAYFEAGQIVALVQTRS